FGSTEVYTFTVRTDAGSKPGCAGRAGVFSRVRLIEPWQGALPQDEVGPGRQGQVIVSLDSPEAFSGYWNRPDADARAIHDGWYYTGDLAIADDDGELWVSGRVDDMINSGGENIYPDEIEAALSRCPAAAEICVVGLPDERWGSVVTAFVVPARHVAAEDAVAELTAHARRTLPALKQPKRVIPVSRIPKSAVGKVLRRVLADGQYERLVPPGDRTANA
ncbi:MAG: class I adenylate-forming enzyme family protein, partial [Streptosporangiaceae bacterium]